MFTKPLEHIFTAKSIKISFEHLNPRALGIDNVSYEHFKGNRRQIDPERLEKALANLRSFATCNESDPIYRGLKHYPKQNLL